MSSLRNAHPQRPYRERDQPQARARLGLLEKRKDYRARAKDYNAKKARLKALRQKAADRNEDEFNFAMMSSRTKDGVKIADRGNKALSNEVVKLLKTQDAGYLRTVRTKVTREREQLEVQMQIGNEEVGGVDGVRILKAGEENVVRDNRIIFVKDEQAQKQYGDRPRRGESAMNKSERNIGERNHEKMLATLDALRTRESELITAERELELQRAKMSNTAGGINKNGVKFKVRERKR